MKIVPTCISVAWSTLGFGVVLGLPIALFHTIKAIVEKALEGLVKDVDKKSSYKGRAWEDFIIAVTFLIGAVPLIGGPLGLKFHELYLPSSSPNKA